MAKAKIENFSIEELSEELHRQQEARTEEINGTCSLLDSLLLAINAAEGLEIYEPRYDAEIVRPLRKVLKDLGTLLGSRAAFCNNTEISRLDAIFDQAGWDDQGFRYHKSLGPVVVDVESKRGG